MALGRISVLTCSSNFIWTTEHLWKTLNIIWLWQFLYCIVNTLNSFEALWRSKRGSWRVEGTKQRGCHIPTSAPKNVRGSGSSYNQFQELPKIALFASMPHYTKQTFLNGGGGHHLHLDPSPGLHPLHRMAKVWSVLGASYSRYATVEAKKVLFSYRVFVLHWIRASFPIVIADVIVSVLD